MKRIIILIVVLFTAVTFNTEAKKNFNGVGGYFYSQLAPYGAWIEIDYGVVVWRPTNIRVNWMPYQMGQWIWTYDGWYWDSYEPFGFITYHYGRWYFDDYYGWLWYPDYEWAPAWVEWRYDNDYIGWAPLHPYAVFSVSVGIYFTTTFYTPYYHWNYVSYGNFCDPYVYNYYVASGIKHRIHSGTKYRNNFVYYNGRIQNRGVDVNYVSIRSGQKIKQRDLIRVSDSRELSRDGYRGRDEIRTLDMKRDELVRNDLGRMEIKRENRKTSVDVENVKIGRRENVTTEIRTDVSRERNLDGLKTDQNRKDVKNIVDRVFEENKSQSNSNNKNINRQNDKVEKHNQTKETISRNETQVKQQNNTKSNESVNSNRKNQGQTVQMKQEKQKVVSNDETKKTKVRQQSDSNIQTNRSSETKKSENKTSGNDNSQDRKRK